MTRYIGWRLVLVLLGLVACWGCDKAEKPAAESLAPAHVAQHVDENDLNKVTLTEEAEARLGIQLAEVKRIKVKRKRTVGGDVILPPGKTISVSAPLAGTLLTPPSATVPSPGVEIQEGQAVFNFRPLLTPERDVLTPAERVRVAQTRADIATAKIESERQIESAKVAVEAAQIAYDRAVQLLQTRAGSQRSVDEARASLQLAQESLRTAEARHKYLSGIELDEAAGQLESRTIDSPVSGVLQRLDAAVGETVAAGESLFSVMTTSLVWVRVPVYVGQWREIDTAQPAQIAEFGQSPTAPARPAQYVSAPPSANPDATTVDVYYALANDDGALYPGQKLAVTLPLKSQTESLVVPTNAVLYDIHGGAWVYQQIEPHVYARGRIAVDYVDGDQAVLTAGPEPGSLVVTLGAAELFGTEFGVGH